MPDGLAPRQLTLADTTTFRSGIVLQVYSKP
jgi:hypothetical protein